MRFLEATNFFVRTIMFDFINRDEAIKLKFRLAPMIHIGTKAFYKTVIENIRTCDEIFYEGIFLSEKKKKFYQKLSLKYLDLTSMQYKRIAHQLDLVTQSAYFDLKTVREKLTHTDYNPISGKKAWDNLNLLEKIKLTFLHPIELFVFRQGLSRAMLAKHYMQSAEEAYLAYGPVEDELGTATNFVMNEREQIIFKSINQRMESEAKLDKTIGIVYGAGHMKSIARYLIDKHNYVPRNGKFMKVFDVN